MSSMANRVALVAVLVSAIVLAVGLSSVPSTKIPGTPSPVPEASSDAPTVRVTRPSVTIAGGAEADEPLPPPEVPELAPELTEEEQVALAAGLERQTDERVAALSNEMQDLLDRADDCSFDRLSDLVDLADLDPAAPVRILLEHLDEGDGGPTEEAAKRAVQTLRTQLDDEGC